MFNNETLKRLLVLCLVAGIFGLAYPKGLQAASTTSSSSIPVVVIPEQSKMVKFKKVILNEKNRSDISFLAGEETVLIRKYNKDGVISTTVLLNTAGSTATFWTFRMGDALNITGYKLPDGRFIAIEIQKVTIN